MASHLHGKIGQNIFSRKIIIQLLFFQVINTNQVRPNRKADEYKEELTFNYNTIMYDGLESTIPDPPVIKTAMITMILRISR
jgi:hypothetical protein